MGVDIVVAFDTTGSMRPALAKVRQEINELLGQLYSSMEDLRVCIVAHGDYCDARHRYVVTNSPFTSVEQDIRDWLSELGYTSGGDWRECYAYVLHKVGELDWRPDSQKVLLMIGDAEPHRPGQRNNGFTTLDWIKETEALVNDGVTVHTIQCLGTDNDFWRGLAKRGGGKWLPLAQFRDIVQLLIGVGLHTAGGDRLDNYIAANEVTFNLGLRQAFEHLIDDTPLPDEYLHYTYGGGAATISRTPYRSRPSRVRWSKVAEDLEEVPEWRFQMLDVPANMSIRQFVEMFVGVPFAPGKGFYELQRKSYTLQEGKEVVLRNKDTGKLLTGKPAREMIGIPYGERARISISRVPWEVRRDYDVFVQSTSYNRKLIAGSKFLYEVPKHVGD